MPIAARCAFAFALLAARAAVATPYESGGDVQDFAGTYTETIPIVVPPFHGIEPKLSFEYQSTRGSGMLGVGWALQGLSVIERLDIQAGHRFYLIDGQLLIPCPRQNDYEPDGSPRSPSCEAVHGRTGITDQSTTTWYSTLNESYLRIEHGTLPAPFSSEGFVAVAKDGTRHFYTQQATGKFALRRVQDVYGHTVDYAWHGAQTGFAFNAPQTIAYNGTVISFHYEPRALAETFAQHGALDTMDRQLITVDVCVNPSPLTAFACTSGGTDPRRARAYALTYLPSNSTARPLLRSIQTFGKDASLSLTGVVVGGSRAPTQTFGWSEPAPAFSSQTIGAIADWGSAMNPGMVDFNGDGRADFCRDSRDPTSSLNLKCALSTGAGLSDVWVGEITDWGTDDSGRWIDWNGDGRSDFCRVVLLDRNGGPWTWGEPTSYRLRCAFAAGVTINDMQVGAPLPDDEQGHPNERWFVDWNGDGRGDYCRALNEVNSIDAYKLTCALSTGTTYIDRVVGWFDAPNGESFDDVLGYPETRAMVDWNGDGRLDLCRIVDDSGTETMRCLYGHVDVFDRDNHLNVSRGNMMYDETIGTIADRGWADSQWWADVNGDGKSDYCRFVGADDMRCAISSQRTLLDVSWFRSTLVRSPKSRRFADINGDGKADFCFNGGAERKECFISAGLRAVFMATNLTTASFYEKHWMVDWDGDGRAEYCMNTGSPANAGSTLTCVWRNRNQLIDLVTSVSNGIGGTTTVAYASSAGTRTPRPVVTVVDSVTRTGGAEGPTRQRYTYDAGRYDHFTRRFLGFEKVTRFDPCLPAENPMGCPFTETLFRLDPRWPAAPTRVSRRGGVPAIELDRTELVYADSPFRPYRSELLEETQTRFEGIDSIQTRRRWTYDGYGNVERLDDLGVIADTTGTFPNLVDDDKAIVYVYAHNQPSYIVDKAARITGSDVNGMLTDVVHTHDPFGRATQTQKWLNTSGTYLTTTASYDAHGNVVRETTPNGGVTDYEIDTIYGIYVTRTTRPAAGTPVVRQSTSTPIWEWDVRCGEKLRETHDQNAATTVFTFDLLCRKTRTELPGGDWEAINYNDVLIGTPDQSTEVSRPGPAQNGAPIWKRTYFDGRGRTTKVVRRGADLHNSIVETELTYNARGGVATKLRPRYETGPLHRYTYSYDLRDRETSAVLFGVAGQPGDSRRTSYTLLGTTTLNIFGHAESTLRDVRGRVVWVGSTDGSLNPRDLTTYKYDRWGNVARIDQLSRLGAEVASTRFTYDSLGRKLSISDPDGGERFYTYDANGNLVTERDAAGILTRFTYDLLDRRTSKTLNACKTCQGTMVTWTYDQRRSSYKNVGHLTSTTDASGVAQLDYDIAGRLVRGGRSVDGKTYELLKQYDLGGRLIATQYPDGSTVGTAQAPIEYDGAGRVRAIPRFISSATYDAEGNVTHYLAVNSAEASYDTANPRGAVAAYTFEGRAPNGSDGLLGEFAASNTSSATQNVQPFAIQPALVAGQTITVSTCSRSLPGASGTGDTHLRLMRTAANGATVEVAASDNAFTPGCGVLSTLTFTVPPGMDGMYAVHAGCAGAASCSGAVAARLEDPGANVALGAVVAQSSVFDPACGPPSSVVDGNPSGVWCTASSMLHTHFQPNPWMLLDLGSDQQIKRINVWNRDDTLCDGACKSRLADFEVSTLPASLAGGWKLAGHVAGTAGWPTQIGVDTVARYVLLRLRGTNYLNIPEIEVIGPGTSEPVLTTQPVYERARIDRDFDGRITRITTNRARSSWSYGYTNDARRELWSASNAGDPSLSRDYGSDNGNLYIYRPTAPWTTAYGTAPGVHPHAIVSESGTTFTYDANGHMASSSADGTLTWDAGRRLVGFAGVSYTYDADGARLKKEANGIETIYLGDDYEITDGVHTKYITLGGRLVAKEAASERTWLFADHLGSVVLGLDEGSALAFTANYGPFGETIDGDDTQGRGYTGQRKDENGLLYLHARYAMPATGRFLSPDPTMPTNRPIGMNRYAYAGNDPINHWDIDGLGDLEALSAEITSAAGDVAHAVSHLNLRDILKHQSIRGITLVGITPQGTLGPFTIPLPRLDRYLGDFNIGIGNTLALLPNTINAAGRGDWKAFARSFAQEVVISTAIAVSIMSYGTAAAPAVAATHALAFPFTMRLIETGSVTEAALATAGNWRSLIEDEDRGAHLDGGSELPAGFTHIGTVVDVILEADEYAAVASRAQATSTTPQSHLSASSGTRFGYGYRQRTR